MARSIRLLINAAFLLLVLSGCGVTAVEKRSQKAQTLATGAGFVQRQISAAPFTLMAYERIETGLQATVYIEGDGLAWLSRKKPSDDPTPTNPVALRLAIKDTSPSVIYLGRPCQFSRDANCTREYWTHKRFAVEVISSMDSALDDIKSRYKIAGFNLVGFSGGGAVAALLAARRNDIVSLRTVAGNLDTLAFSRLHSVSLLTGSLNPVDISEKIACIPQVHFAGADDDIVTPQIVQSFIAASKRLDSRHFSIVADMHHENGWVEAWPKLLLRPLAPGC